MDSTLVLAQARMIHSLTFIIFKVMFFNFILPCLGLIVSGFILQVYMGRKNLRSLVASLATAVNEKIGYKKFDDSINRLHGRIDVHVAENAADFKALSEGISWIRGFLEKNGKN